MMELFEDERLQGYATMTGYNIVSLLGYGDNVNVNMKDRLKAFEIAMRRMKTEDGEAYRCVGLLSFAQNGQNSN